MSKTRIYISVSFDRILPIERNRTYQYILLQKNIKLNEHTSKIVLNITNYIFFNFLFSSFLHTRNSHSFYYTRYYTFTLTVLTFRFNIVLNSTLFDEHFLIFNIIKQLSGIIVSYKVTLQRFTVSLGSPGTIQLKGGSSISVL